MCEVGQSRDNLPAEVNFMHVCLPCNERDKFVSIVVGYAKKFSPRLLIINSTVPLGTTLEVSKHCRCLARALAAQKTKKYDVFNVGSEEMITVRKIGRLVVNMLGLKDVQFKYAGGRTGWPGDVPLMLLSIKKLKVFGWKPKFPIEESIFDSKLADKVLLTILLTHGCDLSILSLFYAWEQFFILALAGFYSYV